MNIIDRVIQAAGRSHTHRGGGWRSVTELIGPAPLAALKHKHPEAIEAVKNESVNVWALFGTATHQLLEMAAGKEPDLYPESYMSHRIGGHLITGTADLIYKDGSEVVLCDWKTTKAYSLVFPEKIAEWEAQLNIYAYILHKEQMYNVDKIEVVALIKDWDKYKAMQGSGYPKADKMVLPLTMWSSEQTEEYILDRIKVHEDEEARQISGVFTPCSPAERYAKKDVYSVKKKGGKRAMRNLNTEVEARQWMADNGGDAIEHRQGDQFVRCRDYCDCAKAGICPFYKGAENG